MSLDLNLMNAVSKTIDGLARDEDKTSKICAAVINNDDFINCAARSPDTAISILKKIFNSLNAQETGDIALAFIQSSAAVAFAKSTKPEYMVDALNTARKKMSEFDKETFDMFLPMTPAGQALKANYPAAAIRFKMG